MDQVTKIVNTNSNARPRAINVLLIINNKVFDLNKMGLINMSFDRYLSNPKAQTSGILSTMDITMFDQTGNELLALLQQSNNKLQMRYGFDNNLSPLYNLDILKMKSSYTNQGMAMALGAIGKQINQNFPAEAYKTGTLFSTILEEMARRNNWLLDIDTGNLRLPRILYKTDDELDINFIINKLLPLANKSIVGSNIKVDNLVLYDAQLFQLGSTTTLIFKPMNTRSSSKRVWTYTYGIKQDSNIISLTNTIDYSFLINGLTIELSADDSERYLLDRNDLTTKMTKELESVKDEVQRMIEKYNLPLLSTNSFKYKVKVVKMENAGNIPLKDRLIDSISKAMQMVNTAELKVIGNKDILPTDLVELIVKNKDNSNNILTSPTSIGSYWRIVGITEEIGTSGYTTTLKLVREFISI